MQLDGAHFGRHLRDYERSAWRLETQPTYTMPNEQAGLALWRAGAPKPTGHNEAWHETVRANVAAGKSIGRVRTVRDPLTEYQRFQIDWGIPGNVAAGEDIRILDLTQYGLRLPEQDFWLFDDSIVVHLNFNPDGTLIDIEQIENPDLSMYLTWRDLATKHAVPFSDYTRNR